MWIPCNFHSRKWKHQRKIPKHLCINFDETIVSEYLRDYMLKYEFIQMASKIKLQDIVLFGTVGENVRFLGHL